MDRQKVIQGVRPIPAGLTGEASGPRPFYRKPPGDAEHPGISGASNFAAEEGGRLTGRRR